MTMADTTTALLPPYARALDMTVAGLHNGAPLIEMPFASKVQGRPGYLHGGAISGLLEMAAVAAIQHALHQRGDEASFKQVNVTIDFMRGGLRATTYAVGEVVRLGRTMANVEARAWQDDPAKPITIAYLHYLLKRPEA
jgi:uncharacterized protein (TIGR00369 family)